MRTRKFALSIIALLTIFLLCVYFLPPFFRPALSLPLSNTLTVISDDVFVRRGGSDSCELVAKRASVEEGDWIITSCTGRAVITFFEGSSTEIEPNTIICVEELLSTIEGSTTVRLSQQGGRTWNRVAKLVGPGSSFEVQTSAAAAVVRGTLMSVEEIGPPAEPDGDIGPCGGCFSGIGGNGTTAVKLYEGEATVSAQGQEVAVTSGYQTTVAPGQPPVPSFPMQSRLVVEITQPADGASFTTCQDFTLTASVSNTGEANATGVNVAISFSNSLVQLQPAEVATRAIGALGAAGTKQVSWALHCNGSGSTLVSVNITAGNDTNTGEPVLPENIENASITVNQENKAHLVVDIISPADGAYFSICQNFTVNATVSNTGEAAATGVNVTISFSNSLVQLQPAEVATRAIGTLGAAETKVVGWALHCNGPGSTLLSVNITAGDDVNTGEPVLPENIENATITINQQNKTHLVVEITQPADGAYFSTCQNFALTANVSNTGGAAASGVNVTIWFSNSLAQLQPTEVATRAIGALGAAETKQISWALHCNGSGSTLVSVNITAGDDVNTGEPVLPENIENAFITVNQENKTHLVVDITSPADGAYFSTCQNFTVNATVTNSGEAAATGVNVTIWFSNSLVQLQPAEVATRAIGALGAAETKQVGWALHCNGSGSTLVSVNITAGDDTNTGQPVLPQNIENATITVNQENKTHLVVEILSPADGACFFTCQDFTLTAIVSNTGEAAATGVDVSISFGNTLVDSVWPDMTIPLGALNGGQTKVVVWVLHCNGSGSTLVSVNITAGNDTNTGEPVLPENIENASITVNQENKAHLVVEIISPADGAYFSICQNFTVNATISNTGEFAATGVNVTISFNNALIDLASPAAAIPLGTINSSETKVVGWALHCNGPGTTVISVDITAGDDVNTGQPILPQNIENASITVNQENRAHLVVEITQPADGAYFSTYQNFTVNATVTNTGEAAATGVNVTISFSNTLVELQPAEVATRAMGTLNGGQTKQASWALHCNGSGSTLVSVNITAGDDVNTGEPILPQNIENASITVNQENKAHLVVDITFPADGTNFSTYQQFSVNASVSNVGGVEAINVYATLNIAGNAAVVPSQTQFLGNITPGSSVPVNWALNCTAPGDVLLNVTAHGTDKLSGYPVTDTSPTVTVQQENKAHLVVDITSPVDGAYFSTFQNFTVNATVSNTGEAAATGVNVTISFSNTLVELQPAEVATRAMGTLNGGQTEQVGWALHCNGPGTTVISVDITAGDDVNTGEPVLWQNIENDTVTIQQENKAHLVVDITSPANGAYFSTYQNFTVNASVSNTGDAAATGVNVTISFSNTLVELQPAEVATRAMGTLNGGQTKQASWALHCNGSGSTVISVDITAGDDVNTGEPVLPQNIENASMTVNQENKAHLVVEITFPADGAYFSTCQWVQTAQADFEAGVLYQVDTSSSPGDVGLAANETNVASQANGGIASASFESAGKEASNANDGDTGTEWGAKDSPQWLQIQFSSNQTINKMVLHWISGHYGEDFQLQVWNGTGWVTVANVTGNSAPSYTFTFAPITTDKIRYYDTTAHADWAYLAEFEAYAAVLYSSGTIASQVLDTLADGTSWNELSWNETLPSGTDITFEVRGSNSPFAKDDATIPWISVGGTSPVTSGLPSGRYLQWRATLTTLDNSITPILQDVTVSTGFTVNVTVSNTGEATATGVNVTISFSNSLVELEAAETPTHSLGDIAGGESKTTSWAVYCNGSGTTVISVNITAGDDVNTGELVLWQNIENDTVTVNQQE